MGKVGVYIHIPFCKSRCLYCDFFSTTQLDKREEYVQALIHEAQQRIPKDTDIHTIYFGGGTPSMLSVEQIKRILDTVHPINPIEITLEANPGDLSPNKLHELYAIGINRLSIGIQSFRDEELRLIGRRHTAEDARKAVRQAQEAGFGNISIDLIYALPGQKMADWEYNIAEALKLNVQHISCYCLSYESGTRMTQLVETGQLIPANEDTENDMYNILCEKLKANGFEHYEVSNFALPCYCSQHNSSYWNGTPYIGLGAGAHSYDGNHRRWNTTNLTTYIDGVNKGMQYWEEEELTIEQKEIERIMLGLRTKEGISASKELLSKAKSFIDGGKLYVKNERLIASQEGLHILNRIIEKLI